LFYLVYRLARYREWKVGFILMGMVAGYLPWLMYLNRTVFQFYTIAFEPYLLLGLTFCLGVIMQQTRAPVRAPFVAPAFAKHRSTTGRLLTGFLTNNPSSLVWAGERRVTGVRVVVIFLILATLVSAFFYPLWTGSQTSYEFWRIHTWMESWR